MDQVSDVDQRLACRWCRAQSPVSATSCERCGAPLDVRDTVTDSGWRQAPRLRDLTEVTFGSSVLQIDGTVVPVADVNLGEGDSVFFEHHVMLWKDEHVFMSVMAAPGGMKRLLGDLPFVLSVARGPGRVSFSRDSPGELIVKPIDSGVELDVREHAVVMATAGLTYSFEKLGGGMKATLAAGTGMYLDRFTAAESPAWWCCMVTATCSSEPSTRAKPSQVEPGGFLYKDSAVGVETVTHKLVPEGASGAVQGAKGAATRGLAGLKGLRALKDKGIGGLMSGEVLQTASAMLTGPGLTLMRLTGPGRVGIQSMYMEHGSA